MRRAAEFMCYYIGFMQRRHAVQGTNARHFFERHGEYAGSRVYSALEMGKILSQQIKKGTPFMAGRFGGTELSALKIFDFGLSGKYDKILNQMQMWSGFFPNTMEAGKAFCALMLECIPEIDVLGVWGQPFEDYYLKKIGTLRPQIKTTYLLDLEPWSCAEAPWSAALQGKKVLMIHPFTDTIQKQYERRERIFPGTAILPEFDLKILKAVQTIAGERDDRFPDWFAALDWMYTEALKIDFDVAIIGCGAYGFPLAAKLKKAGKQAIHLAGATQLLFGIKGKRWEQDPAFSYVQKYFNDAWVYPDESEKPQRALAVEGGCYW